MAFLDDVFFSEGVFFTTTIRSLDNKKTVCSLSDSRNAITFAKVRQDIHDLPCLASVATGGYTRSLVSIAGFG